MLRYGASGTSISVDDRTLAHLQVVITTKLRRNEGFLLQWGPSPDSVGGRGAAWIHPSSDLVYDYGGDQETALDPAALDTMMSEASGRHGLRITVQENALV